MENKTDWQVGKKLKERLYHMLKNELMCDIKLLVGSDETVIHVHKFMLASASPVFYCMFNGPMAETGDVKIPDIELDIFQEIVKFIYTDDADISFENISKLVYGADKYMLVDMKKKCCDYLLSRIDTGYMGYMYACTVLQLSHDIGLKDVERISLKYICENGMSCLRSEYVSMLTPECLRLVIESDGLFCTEKNIYELTIEWGRNRCRSNDLPVTDENIRTELGDLLYLVRFAHIDKLYFTEEISNRNILTNDEILKVYQAFVKNVSNMFSSTARLPREERLDLPVRNDSLMKEVLKDDSSDNIFEDCLDFETKIDCHIVGISLGCGGMSRNNHVDLKLLKSSDVLNITSGELNYSTRNHYIKFETPSKILSRDKYRLTFQLFNTSQPKKKTGANEVPTFNQRDDRLLRVHTETYISMTQKRMFGNIDSILFQP